MTPELRTVHLTDESEETERLATGFLQAVARGFHSGRVKPEVLRPWLETARADAMTLRGGWLPEEAFGGGSVPVATFAGFDKTLNAGRDLVPLRMITDITVSPAHRRQGWLRRMLAADLADAAARGVPVAALTVSEATIYGRFGFGAATFRQGIEVTTDRRFALRDHVDTGRVELVEPADAWPVARDVFARFHRQVRGSVDRPGIFGPLLRGEVSFDNDPGNDRLRAAVHLDAAGEPDGHVFFHVELGDGGAGSVVVDDLVAPDPAVHLALWRLLADIDLTDRVIMRRAPAEDPLRWALTNAFCYRTTALGEHIWVRILDIGPALQARPWAADGDVVLEVDDAMGYAAGRYAVHVRGGAAEVARTDEPADVALSAETLASLYLGGVRVGTLARAGRLQGSAEALARFAAITDLASPPYSVTSF